MRSVQHHRVRSKALFVCVCEAGSYKLQASLALPLPLSLSLSHTHTYLALKKVKKLCARWLVTRCTRTCSAGKPLDKVGLAYVCTSA